jgi:rhodanese-related sulfurtransferase
MPQVVEIRPSDFVKRWPGDAHREAVVLLDVREHDELERAALSFARHIPMAQVPTRIAELDPDATIVVMCHGGMRSLQVAHFLVTQGFSTVMNLSGGIDAWAREVDSTIPRY